MTVDRRTFLTGSVAALGGAALATGGLVAVDAARPSTQAEVDAVGRAVEPFTGPRQAGVATPPQAFATWVAFDLLPGVDRRALLRLMTVWTQDAERLTSGRPALADTEPELAAVPARLTVTVGFGPGVFDAAGLAQARPAWLAPLPPFSIDRLEARWSDGDLAVQLCADDLLTLAHATRVLVRGGRQTVRVRWVQHGFRRSAGSEPAGTTMRNLMGQVDGTVNPVPGVDDHLVWHAADAPDWLVGGTSMLVRRISMDLDGWERVDAGGRDLVLGRRQATGAPLTGTAEHDVPDLAATDAIGLPVIDTAAHVRRARSPHAEHRFLRRGYSYDDGTGTAHGSGLVFVTFQRDVTAQLVPVQARLAELDLLNRWTTPIGSAVFAVPGGVDHGEVIGARLLAG